MTCVAVSLRPDTTLWRVPHPFIAYAPPFRYLVIDSFWNSDINGMLIMGALAVLLAIAFAIDIWVLAIHRDEKEKTKVDDKRDRELALRRQAAAKKAGDKGVHDSLPGSSSIEEELRNVEKAEHALWEDDVKEWKVTPKAVGIVLVRATQVHYIVFSVCATEIFTQL